MKVRRIMIETWSFIKEKLIILNSCFIQNLLPFPRHLALIFLLFLWKWLAIQQNYFWELEFILLACIILQFSVLTSPRIRTLIRYEVTLSCVDKPSRIDSIIAWESYKRRMQRVGKSVFDQMQRRAGLLQHQVFHQNLGSVAVFILNNIWLFPKFFLNMDVEGAGSLPMFTFGHCRKIKSKLLPAVGTPRKCPHLKWILMNLALLYPTGTFTSLRMSEITLVLGRVTFLQWGTNRAIKRFLTDNLSWLNICSVDWLGPATGVFLLTWWKKREIHTAIPVQELAVDAHLLLQETPAEKRGTSI